MLTRSGLGVAVGAMVLGICGWWWGYRELIVVAVAALVAVTIAVWSARAAVQANITRTIDQPRVARGNPVRATYRVTNPSRRRSAPIVLIDGLSAEHEREDGDDDASVPERDPNHEARVSVPALDGHHDVERVGMIPTRRRGRFAVGPWTLERIDSFGLAAGRRVGDETSTVIVHPRILPLVGPYGAMHTFEDESSSRSITSDPLSGFVSLREYVDGDDPRLIHWPTSARAGTLMLREHVEQRRPEFTVVLDCAESVGTDIDFEEGVDVTASIAVHAIRSGVDVRLATTSREHPGTIRPIHQDTMVLDLLTPITQVDGDQLMSLLEVFHAGLDRTTIVLVTGPLGPSSAVRGIDRVSTIRVGTDAETAPGVMLAVESADEFAERWRPWS